MKNDPQDSFELFADTLTITLGCIIFIALLLVTITRSDQMDKSGLFHFERRSELLMQQIEMGNDQAASSKQELDQGIARNNDAANQLLDYENMAQRAISSFLQENDGQYATALLSENVRSQLFLTKLPWMLEAIKSNSSTLEERIDRAFAESSESAIAASVLRERAIDAPIPTYVIAYNEKIYPVPGGPNRDYEHVRWNPVNTQKGSGSGTIWQVAPKEGAGMSIEEGIQHLEKTAAGMTRDSKSQIVVLVYANSFNAARSLLKELSSWNVNFSWRPFEDHQRILMTEGGLPPEAPL